MAEENNENINETQNQTESNAQAENNAKSKEDAAKEKARKKAERAEAVKNIKDSASAYAGAFGKAFLNYIDKGVEVSKKGLKSAGEAINDFSDKSVLRIELSQFKGKRAKACATLGADIYELYSKNSSSQVNTIDLSSTPSILATIEEIKKLDEKIASHEELLKETKAKDSSKAASASADANTGADAGAGESSSVNESASTEAKDAEETTASYVNLEKGEED